MSKFNSFEEIGAWQKARELVRQVYAATKQGDFRKDFSLCDQIRRAGVSIMSNTAEGFERSGSKEFIRFLRMAKGSAGEVRCQLYVALDQEYLSEEQFGRLHSLATETSRMISGLISYLERYWRKES